MGNVNRMKMVAIIQAHNKDWEGRRDISIKKINNRFVIEAVIDKLKNIDLLDEIIIAVPDVKENEIFVKIARDNNVSFYLGPTQNVLGRLLQANKIVKGDIILRVMGQHLLIDADLLNKMLRFCTENDYEFVQTPDDFKIKYSGEVIRSEVLEKVKSEITNLDDRDKMALFQARPIAFIKEHPNLFNIGIYKQVPIYSDLQHKRNREIFSQICNPDYIDVMNSNGMQAGNTSLYRYKFVKKFLSPEDVVLDIACGTGYGSNYLSDFAKLVTGADLSLLPLKKAKNAYSKNNLTFVVQDATELTFKSNTFDKVISIETFEHIPTNRVNNYCSEMKRVLNPNGLFICSTPQNIQGKIPIQPAHEKEYSLSEFKDILSKYFVVEKVYGLRGGVYSEKEEGESMLAVCKKLK